MFFYGEKREITNPINFHKMNANRGYLRHFDNLLYLDFIAKNGTLVERFQAEKEIILCRKALTWWERHPNFEKDVVQREKEKKIKQWSATPASDKRIA